MNSMKGKCVIVTGPTSGIGKEIALQLGVSGASLVLACRNPEKGEQVVHEISCNSTGTTEAEVMHVDMSNPGSIMEFARQFCEKYSSLDVLINNAGVNLAEQPRQNSTNGIELTFAVNVLGYFLLTRELLGLLKASAPSRIVNVASRFASDLDINDLLFKRRPWNGMKAYAQSKACDRLLTWAFARRIEKRGVTANAMAPGLIPGTGLFRNMSAEGRRMLEQRSNLNAAQGADTAVWLASSSEVEGINGKFFEKRKELPCEFRNTETEEKLMCICESLAGIED